MESNQMIEAYAEVIREKYYSYFVIAIGTPSILDVQL